MLTPSNIFTTTTTWPGSKIRQVRWRTIIWLLPAILWHGLGLAFFVNWQDAINNPPIHYTDYAMHYAKTQAVCHFLESSGHLWGYSPFFHAGFADGTVFDVDNKAVAVTSCGLNQLGIPLERAFNITVISMMAIAPFAVYLAARLVGQGVRTAALAQLIALAFWYGDPTVSWMWRGGVISFLVATCGCLAVAAAFWRWAQLSSDTHNHANLENSRRTKMTTCAVWFALGPLVFWIHAQSFLVLVVPLSAGLIVAWRHLHRRARLIPFLWAGWVILLNLPWLTLFVHFLSTKTASDQWLQGGLPQLLSDAQTFHFAMRLVVLGVAMAGLYLWRKYDRRLYAEIVWMSLAASIAFWLGLAYLSVYVGLGDLQPYRFMTPALIFSTLPAALAITHTWTVSPRRGAIILGVLCLATAPALYRARPNHYLQADGTPANYLSGPKLDEKEVCITLEKLDLQSGRVLANDFRFGAYLPVCSGAQVIGGPFTPVWTIYGYANAGFTTPGVDLVFNRPAPELNATEMQILLGRYNVQWAVLNTYTPKDKYTLNEWTHDHPDLFQPIAEHGAFRVYAVKQPASWFLRGAGLVNADYNRLHVSDASPDGVVLKYHWVESLRTEPPLPLRPVHIGQDPVPFIAVDNGGVTDFDIVQHYD